MKREKRHPRKSERREPQRGSGTYWAHGLHPVLAGLENPDRKIGRLLATKAGLEKIIPAAAKRNIPVETVERSAIDRLVGSDSVHQGVAAQFHPLDTPALEEIIESASSKATILVLDQVTDPHNVGAILRSAAVFGVDALVLQDRNAPPESGILAKSASGALESVPVVRIGNLAQALDKLRDAGFWSVGLAGEVDDDISALDGDGRVALVMGSEGEGLRRLTAERCDQLAAIPMAPNGVGSLNVSNAAAVALYAVFAHRRH